jgi:hypothetical protein
VSMYRLVNVSVNPAGRFGAPETEPGPSGVGSWVGEELMMFPSIVRRPVDWVSRESRSR